MQEAATRAIAKEIPFDDAEDLLPWIHTVAWRIVLDARKRDSRLVYEVPEQVSRDNPAEAVEARLRLERLDELIGNLPRADHDVLVRRADVAGNRRESVRRAVRRHRVRAYLMTMLDGVAALGAWVLTVTTRRGGRRAVVSAVAPAVVFMSIFVVIPRWGDAPAVGAAPREGAAVISAPRADPTVAVASLVTVARRPVTAAPNAPSRLPAFTVNHPGPGGGGQVWARPKEADDHFVCLSVPPLAGRCADLPVRITG